MLEIEGDKAVIQKSYDVKLIVGTHQPYKLPYSSSLSEFAIFEFVSSKPNLMQVKQEKISFEPT